MKGKQYILWGVAALSMAAVNAYFFSQTIFAGSAAAPKLAAGEICVDEKDATPSAENPNKVLFISCGGFLE
jgi:hypothetical protein